MDLWHFISIKVQQKPKQEVRNIWRRYAGYSPHANAVLYTYLENPGPCLFCGMRKLNFPIKTA
jgi:hypothetical protein